MDCKVIVRVDSEEKPVERIYRDVPSMAHAAFAAAVDMATTFETYEDNRIELLDVVRLA